MGMKPWNGTCTHCGDKRAYQSFLDCQCPNPACEKYTSTQQDLVNEALDDYELPKRPRIAPDFTDPTIDPEKDIDTTPFYPAGNFGAFGPALGPVWKKCTEDNDDDDSSVRQTIIKPVPTQQIDDVDDCAASYDDDYDYDYDYDGGFYK